MRRVVVLTAATAVAAAAVAAGGAAAMSDGARSAAVEPTASNGVGAPEVRRRPRLPALPREVRQRRRWIVGVKCDVPPFGYINVRGQNAGFDVEIARWFSRYAFGRPNRVTFECAPTPAREPLLTTGRVDLVISTFTYTRDRDTRIDFSRAYYKASGRLLVKNNSPIRSLRDLAGRTVATTSGSIYDRWLRRCFPNTTPLVTENLTNSLLAFNQGRADAVMWDDTNLAVTAGADRTARLTNDIFLEGPYGVGIRQGHTAMKRWVDARLELMRRQDRFMTILRANVPPQFLNAFSRNILRPRNNFGYAPASAPSPETVCP
jgi:polar amino acid transport system substrate-binding protein